VNDLGCISQSWWTGRKWARSLLRRLWLVVFLSLGWGEKTLQKSLLMAPVILLGVRHYYWDLRGYWLVVMDAGHMTDTNFAFGWRNAQWLSAVSLSMPCLVLKCLCRFFVRLPSSGLAVLTMADYGPLLNFFLAWAVNCGDGVSSLLMGWWLNLIATFAVVMGGLAIAKVLYEDGYALFWRYCWSLVSSLWALSVLSRYAHKLGLIRTFFGLDELFLLLWPRFFQPLF